MKKLLALVLAMMMVLSLMLTVNAADPAEPKDFSDKDSISNIYAEAVDVLSALKVVKGDENGFRPKATITRAEVATMLYRIATADVDDKQMGIYADYNVFDDVKSWAWYAGYVNYSGNAQYIKGHEGNFNPDDNVTGYEVLAMILRVVGYDQNHEFEGASWHIRTAAIARSLGITKNISEGTLGAAATREVVAEILFQAMQVPMVQYTMLQNYQPILLVDADRVNVNNQVIYAQDVPDTLMYHSFEIVGKRHILGRDKFGRPTTEWMTDDDADTVANGGKYIVNYEQPSTKTVAPTYVTAGTADASYAAADDVKLSIPMTPMDIEDNGIDECTLATKINNDKSIAWADISEWLNGEDITTNRATNHTDTYLDAIHTTTKYIGQTGRTTEIFKYKEEQDDGTFDEKWTFVYIDTYLAKVNKVTEATKDTNGHIIKDAVAEVSVAAGAGAATFELPNKDGKYAKGDMVLLQSFGGTETTLDIVDAPEKTPLTPTDVVDATAEFYDSVTPTNYSKLVGKATVVEDVTVTGTVGKDDAKVGITDGSKTYYASNTFLAARTTNNTVLPAYYDVPEDSGSAKHGIVNNMIGKTYDLYLDHHGYIIGLVEVGTTTTNVGVITGYDTIRLSTGKYICEVEAFMADGTTGTFNVIKTTALKSSAGAEYFTSVSDGDDIWTSGQAYEDIGIGSLVKFEKITLDGREVWYIKDYDDDASATVMTAEDTAAGIAGAKGRENHLNKVITGMTDTFVVGTPDLNSNSTIFVAEYEFKYNLKPGENDGAYAERTYQVYKGFKEIPTIITKDNDNILYQIIGGNNILIYAKDPATKEYTMKAPDKITVDDSYLVLSRGTTYADYSTYNVLKNGEPETLLVSNVNDTVNQAIDAAMLSGDLIMVTGRNTKGYATSVNKVETIAATSSDPDYSKALANVGGLSSNSPKITGHATDVATAGKDVLKTSGTAGDYLTLDDDVKVLIVNIDRGLYYPSNMTEAIMYANGFTADNGTVEAPHNLVFELNELGYVCALYVLD